MHFQNTHICLTQEFSKNQAHFLCVPGTQRPRPQGVNNGDFRNLFTNKDLRKRTALDLIYNCCKIVADVTVGLQAI